MVSNVLDLFICLLHIFAFFIIKFPQKFSFSNSCCYLLLSASFYYAFWIYDWQIQTGHFISYLFKLHGLFPIWYISIHFYFCLCLCFGCHTQIFASIFSITAICFPWFTFSSFVQKVELSGIIFCLAYLGLGIK